MDSVLTPIPLEKGYHEGLDILFPPEDEKWWDGNFNHFNFDSLFNDIAKSAPRTMADKSFSETKGIINSTNRDEPYKWNESETTFFSNYFVDFLQDGKN